jgi:hypothetical protein
MERISDRPQEEQAAMLRMFDNAGTPVTGTAKSAGLMFRLFRVPAV